MREKSQILSHDVIEIHTVNRLMHSVRKYCCPKSTRVAISAIIFVVVTLALYHGMDQMMRITNKNFTCNARSYSIECSFS